MKCPHCSVAFHDKGKWTSVELGEERLYSWVVLSITCPECNRLIVEMHGSQRASRAASRQFPFTPIILDQRFLVYPQGTTRPLPPEVTDDFADDFKEACLVFPFSPKASAALSRRCLQHLLREKAKASQHKLHDQIEAVIKSAVLPTHLVELLHPVREYGNMAAHPMKSGSTGEIVDVEPGEADWLLDVLEALFDFYLVAPEKTKQRRAELDKKLADIAAAKAASTAATPTKTL